MAPESNEKTLVAFTTCERPHLVAKNLSRIKTCLPPEGQFDLVASIDGLSAPGNRETLSLALEMGIDCVVAEEAEGVGISKNRVVSLFPDYDYYFFIEDDVEVLNAALFRKHIKIYKETRIHHFCLHEPDRLLKEDSPTITEDGDVIRHAQFGSAQINFFTQRALKKVGGWHPHFRELRRGGHTEHSYRIFNAGLIPAPFNYVDNLRHCCQWNNPTSVIEPDWDTVGDNELFNVEIELIEKQLGYLPFSAKYPGHIHKANCLAELSWATV